MKIFASSLVTLSVIVGLFGLLTAAVQTSLFRRRHSKYPSFVDRSVISVVRVLNMPCSSATGYLAGTCYSLHDCRRLKGTQIGSCASGYGVCCIFQRTCGATTSQNATHFTNPGYPGSISESSSTPCLLTLVRPYRNDICQVRLDFMEFELASPTDGNCLDDKFFVFGNNANSPVPILCGKNTGQHMYIDVDNSIGPVHLAISANGMGLRKWNIKISLIECRNHLKAPRNCLQYYTATAGRFSSFNYVQPQTAFENGGYLNNLNYAICFRKAEGRCSQTYTADDIESFVILNLNSNNSPTVGSGEAGLGIAECPSDYLSLGSNRHCGARLNPSPDEINPTINAPVTDSSYGPFVASFKSDSAYNSNGFNLYYSQNKCLAYSGND